MPDGRVYIASAVAVGLVAVAHAGLTWPLRAVVALFAGGATVAFVAEAVAIRLGRLKHHVGPRSSASRPTRSSGGLAWSTSPSGWHCSLPTAGRQSSPAPRWRPATTHSTTTGASRRAAGPTPTTCRGRDTGGVPWWNVVGWLVVVGATTSLALPFL